MKNFILLTVFMVFSGTALLSADEVRTRIVTHPDKVYIYHTKRLSAGHGFKVYRSDSEGGEFKLLTETPVTRARSGGELQSRLGESYRRVKDFFEAETAGELWLLLQSRFLESIVGVSLFPELAESMGMLYVDKTAPVGSEVTYRIEFVDMFGNVYDDPLTRQIRLEPRRPDAPTGLRAENDGPEVALHWSFPGVPKDKDDKVIRFLIYRINQDTGEPELVNEDVVIRNNAYDNHTFRFKSPVVNVIERYFVTAADITGQQSEPSGILSYEIVDVTVPEIVQDVTAGVNPDNLAEIEWAVADDPVVEGYHVYRTADLALGFERLTEAPLPADQSFYIDDKVDDGRMYFYHVTSVNSAGDESKRGAMVMVEIRDLTPPPPPQNFTAEFHIESAAVDLNWDIEEITSDFKSFIILRRREDGREPGAFNRVNVGDLKELSFKDTGEGGKGFHEGGIYRYVVYSSDHAENYSDTVSMFVEIPLFTPPDPPSGLLAINEKGFRINLNWGASPSVSVDEYIIHRGDPDDMTLRELTRVSSSERFYRDETVETGNEYIYAVTAVDRAGNESAFSNIDTLFFRSTTPPRSVRNVQAIERDGGVFLMWESVPGKNLAGYRVYRAGIPTGIYEPVHEGLITDTEYFDRGGNSGKWYRVRAVDNSGNESRAGEMVKPLVSGGK